MELILFVFFLIFAIPAGRKRGVSGIFPYARCPHKHRVVGTALGTEGERVRIPGRCRIHDLCQTIRAERFIRRQFGKSIIAGLEHLEVTDKRRFIKTGLIGNTNIFQRICRQQFAGDGADKTADIIFIAVQTQQDVRAVLRFCHPAAETGFHRQFPDQRLETGLQKIAPQFKGDRCITHFSISLHSRTFCTSGKGERVRSRIPLTKAMATP